jgi:hypothetical protein
MSPSRNTLCACGSGKKTKRCCASKPALVVGTCEALLPPGFAHGFVHACGRPATSMLACSLCNSAADSTDSPPPVHTVRYCASHHGQALQQMRGHGLRCHPEKVPGIVDKTLRDPAALAAIRAQYAQDPESWGRAISHLFPA